MIYLNHLHRPYPRDSRADCQHYMGWVGVYTRSGLARYIWRQRQHLTGRGSRFLAAVAARGIGWTTTRVWWEGTKADERWMKDSHNLARLCPVCNPKLRDGRRRLRADYWRHDPVLTTTDDRV